MRYNVAFNQLELTRYNEGKPEERQLSIIDAIILQQLYWLYKWQNVETIELKDGLYFWAAYGKIIDELPTLGIETKNGMGKRIKKTLIDNGLLKRYIDWKDKSKTYWQFTPEGLKIATPGRMEDPTRTNGRDTPGRTGETPPDERENNYSSIDKLTKDERASLSHFSFLKEYFPEEMQGFSSAYGKKIFNKAEFIKAFDNDMILEGTAKNSKLLNRLIKYARNWVNNQKESDKPEPVPTYLRKIQ